MWLLALVPSHEISSCVVGLAELVHCPGSAPQLRMETSRYASSVHTKPLVKFLQA